MYFFKLGYIKRKKILCYKIYFKSEKSQKIIYFLNQINQNQIKKVKTQKTKINSYRKSIFFFKIKNSPVQEDIGIVKNVQKVSIHNIVNQTLLQGIITIMKDA